MKDAGRVRRVWLGSALATLFVLSGCGPREEKLPNTRVIIESSPEQGAEVMIEGIERGVTPVTVQGLAPGWTDVLLKKENFEKTADRILIREGVEETIVLDIKPLVGYVTFESTPPGVGIFLDGETQLGITPLANHALRVGEYSYEYRMENHYSVTEKFEVKAHFQYAFDHKLKPKEAILSVLSRPSGAVIWINNRQQPEKTPAKFELAPGLYVVGVHTEGFVQGETKFTLEPSEEHTVNIEMKQGTVPQGMVLVPAGEFIWGEDGRSPDEQPRRKVTLNAFYIDKYEVTNEAFKKVFPNHTFARGQGRFPVGNVSWNQAMEYARAVGKRLPTEAEWEKAARGTKGREYPWGDEFRPGMANTVKEEAGGPLPVGSFLGSNSPYGCADMAGNVYEWTFDWYEAYPGNTVIEKDYGQIFRILRGGSYDTDSFQARCARRYFDRMDVARPDYGFRCAGNIEERN